MFRVAIGEDINRVVEIYDEIHAAEEAGRCATGWIRGIYPTKDTATSSIHKEELYVLENENGIIAASARFNHEQEECYSLAEWKYDADNEDVFVMHTLTVSTEYWGRGYAGEFVRFYEKLALQKGCNYLRMDTNAINMRARNMYAGYGFREAGTVPCQFNGIPDVMLICLEKKL